MSAPRKIWANPDHWIEHPPRKDCFRPEEYAAYHHDDVVRELMEALRQIADTEPPSSTWAGDLGIRAIRAHARAALAKIAQHDS